VKVIYSARLEAELAHALDEGIRRFGFRTAEKTVRRIDHVLNVMLASRPRMGQFLPDKDVYKLVLSGTPFIAYYFLDGAKNEITVLALYHRAQQRDEFESG